MTMVLRRGIMAAAGLLSLALLLCTPPLQAELSPAPRAEVPYLQGIPAISGDPEDPGWRGAARLGDFHLAFKQPAAEVPPDAILRPTTVWLGWREDALYIRFFCEASTFWSPMRGAKARYYLADCIEIFLDVKGDSRQWLEVIVSPRNGTLIVQHLATAPPSSDSRGVLRREVAERDVWTIEGWEGLAGLRTATGRWKTGERSGWLVDVAIPPSALRRRGLTAFQPMTVRANFARNDFQLLPGSPKRQLVPSSWSPVPHSMAHRSPARMGTLRLRPPE